MSNKKPTINQKVAKLSKAVKSTKPQIDDFESRMKRAVQLLNNASEECSSSKKDLDKFMLMADESASNLAFFTDMLDKKGFVTKRDLKKESDNIIAIVGWVGIAAVIISFALGVLYGH